MTAQELYRAGNLDAAVKGVVAELRDHPTDTRRRTFLFELLCFAGEYDRAAKHLAILGGENPDAATGALLYQAALAAEQTRRELFSKSELPPPPPAASIRGKLNGRPFESIEDADPRIGARLEIFAAGDYVWLPLMHVSTVQMEAPKKLRELLWAPALVRTGPAFEGKELGEVLIPALSPFSFRHPDDSVRLGRSTVWSDQEAGGIPYGQKMLLVDGEDFPLLEVRSLEITAAEPLPQTHASAQ